MVSAGTILFFLGVLIGALTAGGIAYDIRCWRKMFDDAVWHEIDETPPFGVQLLVLTHQTGYQPTISWCIASDAESWKRQSEWAIKWATMEDVMKTIK